MGFQVGIPVSVVLSKWFVAHGNVGALWVPGAKDEQGDRAVLFVPYAGASVVFLAKPNWNALVETLSVRNESVRGVNSVGVGQTLLVSPGLRYAWNFRSGLQIVAGVGVPIGVGPSRGPILDALLPELRAPVREPYALSRGALARCRRLGRA